MRDLAAKYKIKVRTIYRWYSDRKNNKWDNDTEDDEKKSNFGLLKTRLVF
jgi:uncharacterized protein YjcR